MEIKNGIPVSPGVAIAPALVLDSESFRIPRRFIRKDEVDTELKRFELARTKAIGEISDIRDSVHSTAKEEVGLIFDAHLRMLDDPLITREIPEKIKTKRYTPEYAVSRVFKKIIKPIREINDAYFLQRVNDFYDIQKRLLRNLLGQRAHDLTELDRKVVVVAHDLTPSQTATLDKNMVAGFITDVGGATSHTAILANALGIPAVVGLGTITGDISGGDVVIVDGKTGRVIVNPDDNTRAKYEARGQGYIDREKRLADAAAKAERTTKVDVEALAGWTSAALPGRGTDSVATGDAIPQGGTVREGETVSVGGWAFTVDEAGAVVGLVDEETGRVVADPAHPLGLVSYQSFDAADYERFYAGLTPSPEDQWWARWDNTKPGIDVVPVARSGRWTPTLTDIVKTTVDPDPVDPDLLGLAADGHPGGAGLWVRVTFDPELTSELGVPPEAWIHWSVGSGDGPTSPRRLSDGSGPHRDQGDWAETSASGAPSGVGGTVRPSARVLSASLAWPTKPANRLPEALWWSFNPVVAEPDRWRMDKLGQPVSPLDVVRRGGRSLHGVGDGGLTYDGPEGSLRIQTLDAPLVAPGSPNLLDADPPLPDLDRGWHVLLADNCWGTNFPMWIEGAARYRVRITWRASSRRG